MARTLDFLIVALLLVPATAQGVTTELRKLDPRSRIALQQLEAGVAAAPLRAAGFPVNDRGELDVFIVGPAGRAELEVAGARVRTVLPGLATAFLSPVAAARIAALPGVRRIEAAILCEPTLDESVPMTNAPNLRGGPPSFAGFNGAGVIVGVVDTGVDYDHGDFEDSAGNTRHVNIWDQTDMLGPPPLAYGYGSEWGPADIDAGAAREADVGSHGTHVLGIAAGDGSQTGGGIPAFTYVGMAPGADLISVKTNFMTTGIVDGVAYVFDRAAALGKNAVVNLSLGTQAGPHDGTSAFEAGLSALTGPGRIVATSAGNDRAKRYHSEVLAAGAGTFAPLLLYFSAPGARASVVGYYEATENLSVRIETPDGTVIGPVARGGSNAPYPGQLTAGGLVYLENGMSLTSTGDPEIYLEIRIPDPNLTGASLEGFWDWTIIPVTLGAANGEVDLWRAGGNTNFAFFDPGVQFEELVVEPGNAVEVITVGAYISKISWIDCGNRAQGYALAVGSLAGFSSAGPTRDGRQKPDITGPGSGVGSATSFDIPRPCSASEFALLNDDRNHWVLDGTSMSTPHVAGAVALLLQKFGAVTPSFIKSYLSSNAVVDEQTGTPWNQDWGHGKLFLGDLTDPLAQVLEPNGGETFGVGAQISLTWSAADAYQGVTGVDLMLSRNGGSSWETIVLGAPNTGTYAWTVTGPSTSQALLRVVARDAAGNTGSDTSDQVWTIDATVAVAGMAMAEFELAPVTPNPATGTAWITYTLPRQSKVSVTVVDVEGRQVATLARGEHAPGQYRLAWKGGSERGSARTGLYFVRYRGPGFDLARRVVLVW